MATEINVEAWTYAARVATHRGSRADQIYNEELKDTVQSENTNVSVHSADSKSKMPTKILEFFVEKFFR